MAGAKRTRDGQLKKHLPAASAPETIPPAQPRSSAPNRSKKSKKSKKPNTQESETLASKETPQQPASKPQNAQHKPRQKLPRLPPNASISKRPLLHPAIPTPHSSSSSPKTLYITASSPFVPALKRIRALLAATAAREAQAQAALAGGNTRRANVRASGKLAPGAVERDIAGQAAKRTGKTEREREKVYVKATGRAIPRALEIGVAMQGEGDCGVMVEMGNVSAVDDIEIQDGGGGGAGDAGGEEVPETRIRKLSAVTVSIWLK
ncbi:hypothetical protein IQ07DRAFT_638337 [Pyrenochaeta sp. DS3sAY3a]|nr:hypothetical protein IQ07DRAFT_638337 [Pyrenochaeta sp. DS3sAY3a]